jgi:hypothetical protein
MDRYWLLTNTTYGTWLPGDHRGFVGHVLEHRPTELDEDRRIVHTIPGTPCDVGLPGLPSDTWWTERGSTRKLSNEAALRAAIHYVLYNQPHPLLTWSRELGLNPHGRQKP